MTTPTNLRQLRTFLGLTQLELGSLAGFSRFLIIQVERGQVELSADAAERIAFATGCSAQWLMANDADAVMVNDAGEPFSRADFERALTPPPNVHETAAHHFYHEARLGVVYDILVQCLKDARTKRATRDFMDRVEAFVKEELDEHHHTLADFIHGEQRRANERALREGTVISLDLLSPAAPEPFKRGKERLSRALAALTAKQTKKNAPRNG